ncbi:MAG: hypothetical protein HGA66_07055, partial [Holophaga sp.]|nr:hypothetical protein [Holophaga sp.]
MCAAPLLPLEDALRILAAAFPPPGTPEIRADRDDPALDLSSMDGAALRSRDLAAPRRVLGTLFAGDDPAAFRVEPGTCVRIMTGAALPPGADAVVPVEEADKIYAAHRTNDIHMKIVRYAANIIELCEEGLDI